VFNGAGIHPRCCGSTDISCCAWIGLEQSETGLGSKYHWDRWAETSEGTRCHSAFRNWADGEPNDWQGDENCAVMGFHGSRHWTDISCVGQRASCVCEINSHYSDGSSSSSQIKTNSGGGGGGMDGGGVFGLILLFGLFFAAGGYWAGKHPEQVAAVAQAIKDKVPGAKRAQVSTTNVFGERSTAGLAANDSCHATPYSAPSLPGVSPHFTTA